MENPFNARFSSKYLKYLLKRNRTLMLVLTLAMIFVNPVYIMISSPRGDNIQNISLLGLSFLSTILILASILIPPVTLSYLNSKKALDVYYALPIKRINLFFTQFISILITLWIPFIISFVLGYLISGYFGFFTAVVLRGVSSIVLHLLVSLMISSVLIALSCFVCVNTGTTLNAYLYIGVITLVPYILYAAVGIFSSMYLGSYFTLADNIIRFSSPFYFIYQQIDSISNIFYANYIFDYFEFSKTLIYWMIIDLSLILGTLYIFQKRKQEASELPFTNTWFGPIVLSISTSIFLFMMLSSFRTSTDYTSVFTIQGLVTPVLFTYIIFIVGVIITHKSYKNIFKSSLQFLVISAVTISIFAVGIKTGGFGYLYTVPVKENVESIQVYYTNNDIAISYNNDIVITDSEEMAAIIAIHQGIVDDLQKDSSLNNTGTSTSNTTNMSIRLTYKMRNNSDYSIYYDLSDPQNEIFYKLLEIETFKKGIFPFLDTSLSFEDSILMDAQQRAISLNSLTNFDAKQLHQCIIEDFETIGLDYYQSTNNTFVYQLVYQSNDDGYNDQSVTIDSSFTKTLAYLETLSLDFSKASSRVDNFSNNEKNYTVFLVDEAASEIVNRNFFTYSFPTSKYLEVTIYYDYQNIDTIHISEVTFEDYKKLIPYFIGNGYSTQSHNKVVLYDYTSDRYSTFILNDESRPLFNEIFVKGESSVISIDSLYFTLSNGE